MYQQLGSVSLSPASYVTMKLYSKDHRKSPSISPTATPGATHAYYRASIWSRSLSLTVTNIAYQSNCLPRSTRPMSRCLSLCSCRSAAYLCLCLWSRASHAQHLIQQLQQQSRLLDTFISLQTSSSLTETTQKLTITRSSAVAEISSDTPYQLKTFLN